LEEVPVAEAKATVAKMAPVPDSKNAPVVVDLGSRSRKKIKQLRKGEGSLLQDVNTMMTELKADGTLTDPAQAVIVVVKPQRRRGLLRLGARNR
jgi:Family of unknown function (DUF6200)